MSRTLPDVFKFYYHTDKKLIYTATRCGSVYKVTWINNFTGDCEYSYSEAIENVLEKKTWIRVNQIGEDIPAVDNSTLEQARSFSDPHKISLEIRNGIITINLVPLQTFDSETALKVMEKLKEAVALL